MSDQSAERLARALGYTSFVLGAGSTAPEVYRAASLGRAGAERS